MAALLYQTLRESIVSAIRGKIINHEIQPGERIVELELAREFHTSRGPIREALRQLENEGIVEYTRNVGCSVRTFSFWDSYEEYLLRASCEVMSVRILGGEIPEDSLKRLGDILERMKGLPDETFDQVFACDNAFHEELVMMSQMPRMLKAWRELYYSNLLVGYDLVQSKQEVAARQYESHQKIYAACQSGDCEAICTQIKDHYWRTIARMLKAQDVDPSELHNAWNRVF